MIVLGGDRVVVQGITGRQGSFWTQKMQAYGTRVVAGVNPRRAGETHCGVPVFATVRDAAREIGGVDVSVMFIPPAAALGAAEDAIVAGARLLVVLTEHIPAQDVMRMHALAVAAGCRIVGCTEWQRACVEPASGRAGSGFVSVCASQNPVKGSDPESVCDPESV